MPNPHDGLADGPGAAPEGKSNGLVTKVAIAFATVVLSTAGATGGGYFTAQSNRQAELKVQSRGIARVVQRDLDAAAGFLRTYRPGEELPRNIWQPVKGSDLQKLASKLPKREWDSLGRATKEADMLLGAIQLHGTLDVDSARLGETIATIVAGADSLHAVVKDPDRVRDILKRQGGPMVAAGR